MDKKQAFGFTVLVVTYNANWEKLKITLDSIMRQSFQDYEIVIADDGSQQKCTDEIIAYFDAKSFDRFSLVNNEKNQGTVKNLISGIEKASGKYIRGFGPGDLFYEENSLQKLYDFMEKTKCKSCFGLMRGYHFDDNHKIQVCPYTFPFDIEAYRKTDIKRVEKNLVLFADNVSGAAMCFERNFILEYFYRMEGTVVYLEDIYQVMAVLDGNYMELFDEYLIWYECNIGMSTSGNSKFRKLLMKDREQFYTMLQKQYGDLDIIKKRARLNRAYKTDNPYLRVLKMAFVTPSVLIWAFRHYIQVIQKAYEGKNENGFLMQKEFLAEMEA